ncbi:MAG: MFS transporter [Oryzihumus sp.]
MKRARLLILASTVGMLGWGTVLPYQYAYAANTRGWGGLVAAGASSLFSIGALVAAPVAGRLTDRLDPVRVFVVAKLVAALGTGSLLLAETPGLFLAGMFVFGVGLTGAGPAQSVLVLRWVGQADRRRVFAWQFTGQALGMAVGSFVAGYLVDLHRAHGMWPAFAAAAIGFTVSAGLIAATGLGPAAEPEPAGRPEEAAAGTGAAGIRLILASPALRWTALVTVTLALGFYAQFESGLPAYAITVLSVPERTVGTASAVNCLVIILLQMVVTRFTAGRSAPALLVVVGAVWVASWGLLALADHVPALAGALFVTAFGVFALGETMYAPVLNPLTASLAPAGMVGTTLGVFSALQTGVSAAGPLLAGLALSGGTGGVFLAAHVGISVLAVGSAWRLWVLLRGTAAEAPVATHPEPAPAPVA